VTVHENFAAASAAIKGRDTERVPGSPALPFCSLPALFESPARQRCAQLSDGPHTVGLAAGAHLERNPMPIKAMDRTVSRRGRKPVSVEAKGKQARVAAVVAEIPRFCLACCARLTTAESKKFMLCNACRKYCPHCGAKTKRLGHYDACTRCLPGLMLDIETAEKGMDVKHRDDGLEPKEVKLCESCGDEAEIGPKTTGGRYLCRECFREIVEENA